jgi:molecular chaperone GrpE
MNERQDKQPAAHDEVADAAPPALTAEEQVAKLAAEVARYKEQADRNWQQFLHAAADLENYKKQAARQREDAVQRTRQALLAVMLAVVDDLERALEHSAGGNSDKIVAGIRMSHRKILELLASLGVRSMETKGQVFDPRYHEAVDVASPEEYGVEPGTIVAELQRGYFLDGDVLRHARVRVAK